MTLAHTGTQGALIDAQDTGLEARFYRQLHQVSVRIHNTENLQELMLEVSADICQLLSAERLTLYAVNEYGSAIVSKIKTGLHSVHDIKLPITPHSIAGYAAFSRSALNLADVYDDAALKAIHPALTFLDAVDRRSGYRTQQMLVAPIMEGDTLHGVLQVMNHTRGGPFGPLECLGVAELCKTLASAIRHRGNALLQQPHRRTTKYDALVSNGLLTDSELTDAVQHARAQDRPVDDVLLTTYGLHSAQLGAALATHFDAPYQPFVAGRKRIEALHGGLKREFVLKQGWVPLAQSADGLLLMCLDPEAVRAARVVQQVFPKATRCIYGVTTHADFAQTVAQFFSATAHDLGALGDIAEAADSIEADDAQALESAATSNELVKFVNTLIMDAHQQKASDIHIEPMPGRQGTVIRLRIDGSLRRYAEVPAHIRKSLVARLKIMCNLDISERRKPQDGKIKFKRFGPLDIELRVATIPIAGGLEDVVLRMLTAGEPLPLEQLALSPHNLAQLQATVRKPYGLFYVCGPTGAGKTTTLHSILKFLNTPGRKIWTAEDPVEITQTGLRQVQVNKKAGVDFALLLRAFLRADPDIIMVGESRDKETVAMGIEASLTGHLVLSTLHTNSAPESVIRLIDMGMEPFNFADALLGVLAQRLAKKLCSCKAAYAPDAQELQQMTDDYAHALRHTAPWQHDYTGQCHALQRQWTQAYGHSGSLQLYRAVGCDACDHTGYKGRMGLHELLVADATIKQAIQERARVSTLAALAVAGGMRTLKMDGIEKALQGHIDLKTVRTVCA